MKVFATGATGFVGSHLVDALIDRGDEVRCLVRDPTKAARVFPARRPHMVVGTLTDEAALLAGCDSVDVVFHVAGLTAARNRRAFFHVNADGTRRVAEAAARAAPALRRFVYVSSVSAAGPTTRGRAVTEIAPPRPVSDYGASKLAGEEATRAAPIPWTIVRPPTIYGPRDTELLRVFKLARWRVAPVFGDGKQELSVIQVRDLVRALLCATDPSTEGRTYFASHPEIVTSRALVRAIHVAVQRTLGHDPEAGLLIVPLPSWFTRAALAAIGGVAGLAGKSTVLSANKGNEFLAEAWTCLPTALQRDTGWTADIPLADGLDDTARWYRQHGWL